MTWSAVTGAAKSWSAGGDGVTKTWTAQASNTTTRNTSRFVLLSKVTRSTTYVNLQPAFRSQTADGRGGAFYWTAGDPIAFHTSGESTI